jgi:hypothetical protein
MSISSLCHSNLKFSRLLNESEIEEINSLNHLEVHECFVEQHYNTCQKLGLKFDCLNEWRHLGGELVLTKNEENSCWQKYLKGISKYIQAKHAQQQHDFSLTARAGSDSELGTTRATKNSCFLRNDYI